MSPKVYLIIHDPLSSEGDERLRSYMQEHPNTIKINQTSFAMASDDDPRKVSVQLNNVFAEETLYYVFEVNDTPRGGTGPLKEWFKQWF